MLAGLAVSLRLMPGDGRDLVLAGALISIVANPFVFAAVVRRQARKKGEPVPEEDGAPVLPAGGHAILIGYGRVGDQLAGLLRTRGMQLVVIEDDADLVAKARADGFPVVRGNAASKERLAELGPETATHALLAIPNAYEAGEIVARLRAANPLMTILARAHSETEVRHLLSQRRRRRRAGGARTRLLDGGNGRLCPRAGKPGQGGDGRAAPAAVRRLGLREGQHHAVGVDHDGVAGAELAAEDAVRQRVLQLLLDRALERARAVHRVEADVAEQGQRAFATARSLICRSARRLPR